MNLSKLRFLFLFVLVFCLRPAFATDPETIRVGVLKFGTVNWLLNVVQQHKLALQQGVNLEVVPLGSKNATHVAIQGGAVDMIVTDWVWVSRQRSEGRDFSFAPYSTAVGSILVRPDSGISNVSELAGKKLGVAGGPVDKSWLLLRAYASKELGLDLTRLVEPSFGAPPLLNKLALKGDLQGALNFWHYAARLKAAGFKTIITVPEILSKLGVDATAPLIGWTFHETWADAHQKALKGLLRAFDQAKEIMLRSDDEWARLKPMLKAEDSATEIALREGFREGIPRCFDQSTVDAASRIFDVLAQEGGEKLVGRGKHLSEGTFWSHLDYLPCQ